MSAIFLECSFPKNHPTALLYGHLSVEHLFDELRVLAEMVKQYREGSRSGRNVSAGGNSSKHNGGYAHHPSPLGTSSSTLSAHPERIEEHVIAAQDASNTYDRDAELRGQLAGLGVIIIHVKPALFPTFLSEEESTRASTPHSSTDEAGHGHATDESSTSPADVHADAAMTSRSASLIVDPRTAPHKILDQLNDEELKARLGIRFVMAEKGMRIEC